MSTEAGLALPRARRNKVSMPHDPQQYGVAVHAQSRAANVHQATELAAQPHLAADQHRDLAVSEHFGSLAGEQAAGDSAAAMRSHDDEIAGLALGGSDDRVVGQAVLDQHSLT